LSDLSAVHGLWSREIVRFLLQPSRLASALATPLIFWLLIGSGLTASFRLPGGPSSVTFLEYFVPGTLVLLVLFASIFANISVIEDRHEGFLQSALVAPVSRASLALGKILGGASLAWMQGALFLALAPAAGFELGLRALVGTLGVLALLAVGLTALGFTMAWVVDSTQGFHGVMNLLLIPMWMLSGALFPVSGAPQWLAWLMRLDPLTYGLAALRRALYAGAPAAGPGMPSLAVSLTVVVGATMGAIGAAVLVAGRRS
jgi:daunorubicin resistance ABC transporter membrane protein